MSAISIAITRSYPRQPGKPKREADQVLAKQSTPDPTPKVETVFDRITKSIKEGLSTWTEHGPMSGVGVEEYEQMMREGWSGVLGGAPGMEIALLQKASS